MLLRKAGAALAAGCTMIIKPSPETPLTVLTLCHLAEKAGFQAGVLSVLTTDLQNTPSLSEALCRHPLIRKVTFTGSTRVGKLIAKHCSDGLKKVTLELGGNCPVIVFDDADLNQAADQIMALKWRHAGQACITANRVYVQSGVYDEFTRIIAERTKKLQVGHGMAKDTTMGPLTVPQGLDKAVAHVEDAKKNGGKVLFGGNRMKIDEGFFFEPTMIVDAHQDLLIAREEVFAPVLAFFRFEKEDEAVGWANDTSVSRSVSEFVCICMRVKLTPDCSADGPCVLLFYKECGSHVAAAGKPGSGHDWHEHGQLICRRVAVWWNKIFRLRERVWKRHCSGRVSGYENRYPHAG